MYVAIRDFFLATIGEPDSFVAMDALGISSVELAIGDGPKIEWASRDGGVFDLSSADDRARLMGLFDEKGASICAFLMNNNFSSDDLQGEIETLVTTCEAAEEMGIPAVRLDMILRKEGMSEDDFVRRCADAVRSGLAATSSVRLAVENHGNTTNRPEFMDKVIEATGDDRFGLTLDSGNFYWYGHPLDRVYEIMEKYADRVYFTHIKNISFPEEMRNVQREVGYKYGEYVCPIYEGDIDHARVVSILRAGGYDGPLTVEDESLDKFTAKQWRTILVKDAEYLRSLI